MNRTPEAKTKRLGRDVSHAIRMGLGKRTLPGRGRLVVVGSGKGGTGKTFLAANLAIQWSLWGKRVILVDADLGLANLHLALGVAPKGHLLGLLEARRSRNGHDRDLLSDGPAGLRLLAGGSGIERLAGLNRGELRRLVARLEPLLDDCDAAIVDLSSGISPSTLLFLKAAQEVVLVSNPEPSAVLDAYALVKLLAQSSNPGRIHLVMNRGRDPIASRNRGRRLQSTAEQFLDQSINLLGIVPEDDSVPTALWKRKPLLLHSPDTPAATAIRSLARQLLSSGDGVAEDSTAAFFSRSAELLAPRRRVTS